MTIPDDRAGDLTPLYDQLAHLLRRGKQRMDALIEQRPAGLALTSPQIALLSAAQLRPGMEQAELAAAIACDPATAGGMVKRLEKLGLIARHASPRSRRGRAIYITQSGEAWIDGARAHLDAAHAAMLAPLDAEERRTLLGLLSKMLGLGNSYFRP
ncbi:MAG TPA: MarR family transcriptional regulator [Hyphomicrobiales bacterium]|nr:MarR family transcriptional regulator [Hyphomicrobiales bacterium]